MGLLDTTGRWGGLAGSLGCELFTRGLATGRLACGRMLVSGDEVWLGWCLEVRNALHDLATSEEAAAASFAVHASEANDGRK